MVAPSCGMKASRTAGFPRGRDGPNPCQTGDSRTSVCNSSQPLWTAAIRVNVVFSSRERSWARSRGAHWALFLRAVFLELGMVRGCDWALWPAVLTAAGCADWMLRAPRSGRLVDETQRVTGRDWRRVERWAAQGPGPRQPGLVTWFPHTLNLRTSIEWCDDGQQWGDGGGAPARRRRSFQPSCCDLRVRDSASLREARPEQS